MGGALGRSPSGQIMGVVVYRSTIRTVDPNRPLADAVAVDGDRIVAVGSLAEVTEAVGPDHVIDDRFIDQVLVPGLIDQHLHPILGASTLSTAVIATEDWVLPEQTFPAAHSHDEYVARLRTAEAELDDPDAWLFSWGYHQLWHGDLNRSLLDEISATRPIGVWQRSCHEFFLNSAAIEALGITEQEVADAGELAATIDLPRGRFWERGLMTFLFGRISPVFMTPERLVRGLEQMVTYLHQNGVTAINEPGAQLAPVHGSSTRRSSVTRRHRSRRPSLSTLAAPQTEASRSRKRSPAPPRSLTNGERERFDSFPIR